MFKFFILPLFLCSSTVFAITIVNVKSNADMLSQHLYNGVATTVSTKSSEPAAMVQEYFLSQHEEMAAKFVSKATAFKSEEMEVGIFKSRKLAIQLTKQEIAYCVENENADNEDTEIDESLTFDSEASKLLRALSQRGVYFGYDASGQGWGGMPITILLVVETLKKKVHAITLQCFAYND
jgi:hypothetical protein